MKTRFLFLLLIILPALSFCQSSISDNKKAPSVDQSGAPVAMNSIRVKAIITKINTTPPTSTTQSPCDSLPCVADIEIKEVLATGMVFPANLSPGNTISINFEFTLKPTDKIFPNVQPPLPGLKNDDVFTADIEARMLPGGGFNFYITNYNKLKTTKAGKTK